MPGVASLGPAIPGVWAGARLKTRSFRIALLASLVIHAVLLVGWHGLTRPTAKPAPSRSAVLARLMAPEAVVAPKPEPAPQPLERPAPPASPRQAPRKAEAPRATAAPAAAMREVAIPPPVAVPPAVPASDAGLAPMARPEVAAASTAAAPPAVSAPAVPAAPSAAATPRGEAEPGTLRQYQLAIVVAARKFKRYPLVARDNNWEGKAEVRLVIGASGTIVSLQVKKSSGHEVLDKVALDMVARAMPLTPIPPALRGREFAIEVPVVFSLTQEGAGGG